MIRTILPLALLATTLSGCSVLFGEAPTTEARDSGGVVDADIANDAADEGLGPLLNLSSGADNTRATAVWDGSAFRVVWQERVDTQGNIVGTIIDNEEAQEPIQLISGAASNPQLTAAWGDDVLTAAWLANETHEGVARTVLNHARFDSDFGSEPPSNVSAALEGMPAAPFIIPVSGQSIVAWTLTSQVALSRVATNTTTTLLQDSLEPVIGLEPSLAYSDASYALAWRDVSDGHSIVVRRFNEAGAAAGPRITVSRPNLDSISPHIVAGDNEFALVWQELRGTEESIFFTRIISDGVPSEPIEISGEAASAAAPTLVWNGEGYGAAWQERIDGQIEIVFQELTASGVKLGPLVQLSEGVGTCAGVSLVYNGANYGASWNNGPTGERRIQFRTF